MIVVRTERFKTEFARLPVSLQKRMEKQLLLLLQNPAHPSLRLKKLGGYQDVWEGRLTKGYRFTFQTQKDSYILRRVGTHDILKTP